MTVVKTQNAIPRIIITSGEPAGIGPDLCIKLSQAELNAKILILGDAELLLKRAQDLAISLKINTINSIESDLENHRPGEIDVLSVSLESSVETGMLDKKNAGYVIRQLDIAIQACTSGTFDAMVTGPVHKGVINQAGIAFTGHTEYLAEKTKANLPVMMLQTKGLRIALATTHLPLREVPDKLTADLLEKVVNILHHDLVFKYAIKNPVIMVCGLNPHAGEGGYLGDEEIKIIEPVLNKCRTRGIQVIGPLSADTIFSADNLNKADVFLAMYHDQGLPVIKYKGFGETVNVTLGLPIIRTSVDHGTALSLAGSGKADERSFVQAIYAACDLCRSAQH